MPGFFWSLQQRFAAALTLAALAVIVLFIASAFFSFHEIRYALSGRQTTATILKREPAPLVGNHALLLTYQFDDPNPRIDSHLFEERPSISLDAASVDIRYLPGKPNSSEPLSQRRAWPIPTFLILLVASLAAVAYLARRILKEANALAS